MASQGILNWIQDNALLIFVAIGVLIAAKASKQSWGAVLGILGVLLIGAIIIYNPAGFRDFATDLSNVVFQQ